MKNFGKILVLLVLPLGFCMCEKDSTKSVVPVSSIKFSSTKIEAKVGDVVKIDFTVEPEGASTKSMVWTTDNEKVAKVDANGTVTAMGYGSAYISAQSGKAYAKLRVDVSEPERNYELVWSDEFNGSVIDESVWKFQIGPNVNQEKQFYKKENARIEGGNLVITGKIEETVYGKSVYKYTSARLHTQNSVKVKYGKVEARISLPAGKGTWPAFWMMPNDSKYGTWPRSGEIDIMEHVGSQPTMISNAVHTKLKNGTGKPSGNWSQRYNVENIENNFHTYSIEWIEGYYNGNDAIIFYVDNERRAAVQQSDYRTSTFEDWPFNQDFFIILNLALGGTWGGDIDDSAFPMDMKVDYVRVYKKK